jgi:dipeptidyl aminopeptidase/acylaminoacyl peptidase
VTFRFAAICLLGPCAFAQQEPPIDPSLDISIVSSKDGSKQPVIFYVPPGAAANGSGPRVPLVVFLHSWSTDYKTVGPALQEARRRGWIFAGPNFRGANETPEACASDLAVQDILDSVEYAKRQARVDDKRIYLVGSSGGGHMALLMATRTPQVWSAVSTWVPITDLASWYEFSKATGSQYAGMMDKCLGAAPDTPQRAAEYRRRSSLFWLKKATGIPIAIDAGLRDGHAGAAVPLSQSLLAFNELARANGFPEKSLTLEQIDIFTRESRVPAELAGEKEVEPGRKQAVLFRRGAGPVRLTIFDGAHSVDVPTSFRWLDSLAK